MLASWFAFSFVLGGCALRMAVHHDRKALSVRQARG
ncbi:hypothetical protein K701_09370 [Streptomyces fradiae ATCC 10745 = DSM 40063]|uniref:Lipoprotein n=1 Tax=Streptomyces fradiae ATCC 10745 = DSM 40063 TaxID=1319510 RepID=A0ABQ6XW74_STRFR|nr:hypothetical protein K701_21780 [Streptomyces fradiae ATCC 10745 = DSM 40063]KAF0649987.1 hypothetical protein K701_09370 [Streptomyces fradiae ATCC 10745 = DSM 40063]